MATTEAPAVLDRFEYEKYIEEEGINPQDLPKDIKQKITGLSLQKGKYLKNPTEGKRQSLVKQDLVIADMLIDWNEKDIEETDDQGGNDNATAAEGGNADGNVSGDGQSNPPVSTPPTPAPASASTQQAPSPQPAATSATPTPAPPQNPAPPAPAANAEQEIKALLQKDGRVHEKKLMEILKKDTIGSKFQIGEVKIRRGYSPISQGWYYPDNS